MGSHAQQWTDARLDHLAAALEPVPIKVASLGEAVEHLHDVTTVLQPMPAQVAVLTASVERLSEENRTLRADLAGMQRQLTQVAWALVAAMIGAVAAFITALV